MANVLVGETENFKIWYDPTLLATHPEVVTNATTLMSTVEADFARVGGWFGIGGQFGTGNRINVNLTWTITNGQNGGGDNFGYKSDGTCQIDVNGAPPWTPVAAVIRMLFVAELSEVFMSCTGFGWNRGDSSGEGLSRFCAYQISPAGYVGVAGTGDVNAWMSSPRSGQYITGPPQGTDTAQLSYGSALLYLLYLNSQLNYSPLAIIQNGAATLAGTYQKLGGAGDGFSSYVALLNDFFPPNQPGDAASGTLKIVNPFPLLYGGVGRNLVLSAAEQAFGAPVVIDSGEAYVAPFFTCPKKLYRYTSEGQPIQISLTATTYGFGQAKFIWSLNGTPLVAGGGDPSVTVTYTGPDIPGGTQTETTAINFSWQTFPAGTRLSENIVITIDNPYGIYDVAIECIATEIYAVAPDESDSWTDTIDDRELEWEAQYYRDRQACEGPILQIINRYVHVRIPFFIALTLPDPPPDYTNAVQLLKSAGQALEVLERIPGRERRLLEKLVEYRLGVSASALRGLAQGAGGREGEALSTSA